MLKKGVCECDDGTFLKDGSAQQSKPQPQRPQPLQEPLLKWTILTTYFTHQQQKVVTLQCILKILNKIIFDATQSDFFLNSLKAEKNIVKYKKWKTTRRQLACWRADAPGSWVLQKKVTAKIGSCGKSYIRRERGRNRERAREREREQALN